MAKKNPNDLSVEERLKLLYQLQTALSAIDENTARLGDEIEILREKRVRELENAAQYIEEKKKIDAETTDAEQLLADKTNEYNELTEEMTRLTVEADEQRTRLFDINSAIKKEF